MPKNRPFCLTRFLNCQIWRDLTTIFHFEQKICFFHFIALVLSFEMRCREAMWNKNNGAMLILVRGCSLTQKID